LDTVERPQEMVEKELDAMIRRRSRKGEVDPDLLEPGYVESVRRYNEARRRENRARWFAFHSDMAELHGRLADEHAQKAEALCWEEDRGEGIR
jgi:hypothetical protein